MIDQDIIPRQHSASGLPPARNENGQVARDQDVPPDSQFTEPPRKRRRGGKIYSGCGTCRVRKIKCDEARPRCLNCERSRRYRCDGYEESLSTSNDFYQPVQTLIDWANPATGAVDQIWDQAQDVTHTGDDPFVPWDPFGETLARLPEVFDTIGIPHCLESPAQWLDGNQNEHDTQESPSRAVAITSPMPIGIPAGDGVEKSTLTKRLLHHYKTHVCQLMMPTSAPSKNPWLRLYLPLALQEPCTLPRKVLLHAILAVAAFNRAHLSSTEREFYQTQGRTYKEKAVTMISSILDADKRPNEHFDERDSKHALLAAGLTLTTAEVFSGGNHGASFKYLELCKRIIQATGGLGWWLSDPTCVTLLQIFRCLRILWSTSGWSEAFDSSFDQQISEVVGPDTFLGTPVSSDGSEHPVTESLTPAGDYTLDFTFGISIKTLHCLNQIINLDRVKANMGPFDSWTTSQATVLKTLEADVFNTLHNPDAFTGNSNQAQAQEGMSGYISNVIKENHLWAFHYSTAIFFRRALCDGTAEISPCIKSQGPSKRPPGQYLVSSALEHLENIDTLSKDMAIANTLWPGFIAAVEAVDTDLRHRALTWLARAKRHGIGNIAQAMSLVMEVWRRVDRQCMAGENRQGHESELTGVDWRQVMREKGIYIMLS